MFSRQYNLLSWMLIVIVVLLMTACNNGDEPVEENEDSDIASLEADIEALESIIDQLQDELAKRDETISELESELGIEDSDSTGEGESNNESPSSSENSTLRERANLVVGSLENKNFNTLANYVHPEKGVRFSPYGYVDTDEHLIFQSEEVKGFTYDTEEYEWGTEDGTGYAITLTPSEYYEEYIYIRDFSRMSSDIVENEIESYGNIIVNVEEKYPEAEFVSYYVTPSDNELNWANLILAFEEYEGEWYLVGIAVDRWTI
ncbi:hypothetical protein [Evansella cellulosilytica]|uniref:Uncharacterized protein n=1 Tax=Evansella cellulosilytica (strain ATCC 21833 / DSM 2522 / FERM P-1141 / JCM 9156 / N-4) TaxID=649639 RepID=E6TT66_EVAC2|nr:hypothetical protein [Evansella cellulosilytica]ADU31974.1 hypothetical protein Bcell_3734 [Evansella cellulosilytica DSM 2522]